MVNFLNSDKTLSPDGEKLVEWLDAQCEYADGLPLEESVGYLNTLSGPIKQYYINVKKIPSHSSQEWVEQFSKSWAKDCWRIMEYVEAEAAKANQLQQNTAATNTIADELKAFKESIAEQVQALQDENAQLRAKIETLETPKPAKPAKKPETAPEGDTTPESEA